MTFVKRTLFAGGLAGGLTFVNYAPVAWGSLFGEENATLIQILAQTLEATHELEQLNEAAEMSIDLASDMVETYRRVNAGIEEIQGYSWDEFKQDFNNDFHDQYPGLAELPYASDRLRHWAKTRTRSPFTAYEALTAVAADLTAPVRKDLDDGRLAIDDQHILASESSLDLAAAAAAVEESTKFDRMVEELDDKWCDGCERSPGKAQMLALEADLVLARQNSHIMRLLSRAVVSDSLEKFLELDARRRGLNAAYEQRDATREMTERAVQPPALMDFSDLE